jgi:hypothetical protein
VSDAVPVLKRFVESGNPIAKFLSNSAEASLEDFEKLAMTHPVFLLQSVASPVLAAVRQARSA